MSQADGRNVIGIVGLGLMGTALAERFLEVGYEVRVWNRTRAKANALLAAGARWSDRPLSDCPRVVVSLYTTSVVADVLDSMRDSWRAGTTVIDTTTGDPIASEALERRLRDAGIAYLEAPISGSSVQTRRGEST
ncbi:MAG: NAD(P)-binding domain-containing protein, partial [Verrucomicrobiales bacterium]|nr:NAD(P)-binding domain-containing protein [Verrucomicrobiales bacterium]